MLGAGRTGLWLHTRSVPRGDAQGCTYGYRIGTNHGVPRRDHIGSGMPMTYRLTLVVGWPRSGNYSPEGLPDLTRMTGDPPFLADKALRQILLHQRP